jgi:transcriptional antiterminator NusG
MADDILANDSPTTDPKPTPHEHGPDETPHAHEAHHAPVEAPAAAEAPAHEAPADEPAAVEHVAVEPSAPTEHVAEAHTEHEEAPAVEADDQDEAPEEAPAPAVTEAGEEDPGRKKHWYVVKVQSGREDTIREAIYRRVKKEGLEDCFGQIVIPVEKVQEVKVDKQGRKVTRQKEKKLYPGYLMVEVEYNDRILYLFRETSGVGDFVGAHPGQPQRAPTPMGEKEIMRILGTPIAETPGTSQAPTRPPWTDPGQRVRVLDGPFNGMDGIIKQVDDQAGKLQVELAIFGRPVIVDFDYYQVEQA